MPQPIIWTADVFEGEDFTFLDRIVSRAGVPLVLADLTSISLRYFDSVDSRNGRKILDAVSPAPYWSDTLLVDNGWDRDATGYNFSYTLPYTSLKVEGGRQARFEFLFATNSMGTIPSVWHVTYKELLSR